MNWPFRRKKNEYASRVNYEDKHPFLDWVDASINKQSFVFRGFEYIDSKWRVRRASIVFFVTLLFSCLVFYQIEIPHRLQVGDVAVRDYAAPFRLTVLDVEGTRAKTEALVLRVPIVFDFDQSSADIMSERFIAAFRHMRTRLPISEVDVAKKEFETMIGYTIPDYSFLWLVERKFSSEIETAIVRRIDYWFRRNIAESPAKTLSTSVANVVVVRVLTDQQMFRPYTLDAKEILDMRLINFINYPDRSLDRITSEDALQMNYLLRNIVRPNTVFNQMETNLSRESARQSIVPDFFELSKGDVFLSKGEKINQRHLEVLMAISELKAGKNFWKKSFALALFLAIVILVFANYVRRFSVNRVKVSEKDFLIMAIVSMLTLVTVKFFVFVFDENFWGKLGISVPESALWNASPVIAAPMLIGLLVFSGEIVWIYSVFISLCWGLMFDFNFAFMLISFVSGIAGARGVFNCKTRNEIYVAGLKAGLINALLVLIVHEVLSLHLDVSDKGLLVTAAAGIVGGFLSSVVCMTFIPLFESVFSVTTDVKLLELSNLNHPLLKEMIVKAPGTYHHSMMVGSMVEAAAEEIGANPLLSKVMAYYHDIGKMEHPMYFIENQRSGHNPHDHISPFMSKTLLIAHAKDGVELGMKYKLGKPIIDGMVQHHGTTLISYFYNKAIDQLNEGDPEISEEEFRYPGPKPQFRESALCMLADSIEAAARSLDEPTPTRLQNIVRNIVQRKFADGQLDECNLTLKDLTKVEAAFVRILFGVYHQRIDYPRNAGGGLGDNQLPGIGRRH